MELTCLNLHVQRCKPHPHPACQTRTPSPKLMPVDTRLLRWLATGAANWHPDCITVLVQQLTHCKQLEKHCNLIPRIIPCSIPLKYICVAHKVLYENAKFKGSQCKPYRRPPKYANARQLAEGILCDPVCPPFPGNSGPRPFWTSSRFSPGHTAARTRNGRL